MSELSVKWRAKYPGVYDDMTDTDLDRAILDKHPEYQDLAEKQDQATTVPYEQKQEEIHLKPEQYQPQVQPSQREQQPQQQEKEPGIISKTWNKISEPLYEGPTRFAESVSQYLNPERTTLGLKGKGTAFIEGLGHAVSGLTSPLNLGTLGLASGETLAAKAGLPVIAEGLGLGAKAAGAGMAGHGAYTAATADDWSGRLGGGLEAVLGLAGMRSRVPEIARRASYLDEIPSSSRVPHDIFDTSTPIREDVIPQATPDPEFAAVGEESRYNQKFDEPSFKTTEEQQYDLARNKFNMGRDLPSDVAPTRFNSEVLGGKEYPGFRGIIPDEVSPQRESLLTGETGSLRIPGSRFSSVRDWANDLIHGESGEFDPNVFRRNEPAESEGRRIDPSKLSRENREFLNRLPNENIQDFISRNENNPGYAHEVGQNMLSYARDLLDARTRGVEAESSPLSTRESAARVPQEDIADLGLNHISAEQLPESINHYRRNGREDIADYLNNRYTNESIPSENIDLSSDINRLGTAESTTDPVLENWRKQQSIEGKRKSLEEVESGKKTPAFERLAKMIGEDRAGQISSGDKNIEYDLKPMRLSKSKKLPQSTIESWSDWGNRQLKQIESDPSKPGLSFEKHGLDALFPDAFEITYRDKQGNPIGTLKTSLDGKGISTLAVHSDIGLRRGKVAFEMLKQAFDRGVTEPSGITSDLTRNLIDRVKRLAKSESGELNLDALYSSINKMIDSISNSKVGQKVGELFKGEEPVEQPAGKPRYRLDRQSGMGIPVDEAGNQIGTAVGPAGQSIRPELAQASKYNQVGRLANEAQKKSLWGEFRDANRAILTAFDFSPLGRQGKPFLLNKEYYTSLDDMFKSWGSERAYQAVRESIESHPNFQKPAIGGKSAQSLAERAGLDLTNKEEMFQSNIAEKLIPGVRRSERAYNAFLSKLRADSFNRMVSDAEAAGMNPKQNDVLLKQFGSFINDATGRGGLGKLEKAAPILNEVFFAPRLMASRVNMYKRFLNPMSYSNENPILRKQTLKSLISTAGFGVGVGELAKLAGAKVSNDPASSDFRKIKIGDTRIDPFSGFQQYAVGATRLLTGELTSTSNKNYGRQFDLTTGKSNMPSRRSVAENFFANKLAPVPSLVWSWMGGREFDGTPFEAKKAILNRTVPIVMQDLYEIYQEDPKLFPPGIFKQNPTATKIGMGALPIFGEGIQTYGR